MAAGTDPEVDGFTFDDGPQGWTGTPGPCVIVGNINNPIPPLCATSTTHADGTLRTSFETVVNGGQGVLEGTGTWTSGPIEITTADPAGATLEYRRALELDELIAEKGGTARTDVYLHPEGSPDDRTLLDREDLTVEDEALARRTVSLGSTAVKAGTYRLQIVTKLKTDDVQIALGSVTAIYDDVQLVTLPRIAGPTGPTGAQGPTGSTGADGQDGATGPTGPAGQDGADGADGTNGTNGTNGANGADGAQGPAGANGANGAPGAQGPTGPAGPAGPAGQRGGEASVNSAEARRLLTIKGLQPFLTRGRFSGQLRTRVFCRRGAEKRCEGVVKIRTLNKVNTAFKPGRKVMRRVTLGTGAYRLNIGQVGYAKVFTTSLSRKIIGARAPLKVEVLITALDEDGGQQTLRRVFTLKPKKK